MSSAGTNTDAIKIRITYGKDSSTDKYRRGYEKLKKDLEKKYGDAVSVTGKKSSDRDDCFEVAFRDGDNLNIVWDKGIIDSESDLHLLFAKVEEQLAKVTSKKK